MKNDFSSSLRRLNELHSQTDAVYHEMSLKLGLSDSAISILYRCAFSSKQTVHSSLRKLEAEGFLRLEGEGPRDKQVCLTEAGKALASRTALKMIHAESAILASWSKEDVAQYLALSERYLTALQEQTRQL